VTKKKELFVRKRIRTYVCIDLTEKEVSYIAAGKICYTNKNNVWYAIRKRTMSVEDMVSRIAELEAKLTRVKPVVKKPKFKWSDERRARFAETVKRRKGRVIASSVSVDNSEKISSPAG
jgi:hypothetical protein